MKKLLGVLLGILGIQIGMWLAIGNISVSAQTVDELQYTGAFEPMENAMVTEGQFNGYTNHWHDIYWKWFQYGNLFQMSTANVGKTIAQNRVDLAEELGVPGLNMQEGFLNGLVAAPYRALEEPSLQMVEETLQRGNLLIYVDPASAVGQKLLEKVRGKNPWLENLKSHQFGAATFKEVRAYYLESNKSRLFVISSSCQKCRARMKELIGNVESVLRRFDLHRGWFGAGTLLYSVTCYKGHPLEVIGQGMNQGNTWVTFNGYMDYMVKDNLQMWLSKVNLPIVTDVGTAKASNSIGTLAFGCDSWDGLMIQDTPGEDAWIDFVKQRNGYIFRPVYSKECDAYNYDGYIAIEGNKKQIDQENIPFIVTTGYVQEDAPPCMVLFIDKGARLTRERMWEAIISRREVGVLPQGKLLGPQLYRDALEMLMLDRVYLEEYYGDRIHLQAVVEDQELIVTVRNTYSRSISGELAITPAPELILRGTPSTQVILPANSEKTLKFAIQPTLAAMDRTNPIAVHFTWGAQKKSTLTIMDLPRAISAHQLLYGHEPFVTYPVTIHNFSDQQTFPVSLQVFEKHHPSKIIYASTQNSSSAPGKFQTLTFNLEVPAGQYSVKVSALGAENLSQLGVGKQAGAPYLYEVDLNGDGIQEYRMENDHVQATLLSIGARVIEYIVKEKDDNVFFKLWPEKEVTEKRPFRDRGFYPYGGFEDFLGQGSMETHKVYDAEILKKEGDYVQVRMTADYFGNILEKTFTLYGNSPLLEVRFALTFKNPEANMLGPQPILEVGKRHWTEDIFTMPAMEGLVEFRMRPETFYGRIIDLKEGWNAAYDSKEDITFVGAFPVTEPHFLHMWMNHPINGESHHYYAELQPWVPIYQKSTMYFSYYLWAASGPWQEAVKALSERNLISVR